MFSDDDKPFVSLKQTRLFFPVKYGACTGSLNDKMKNLQENHPL